MKENTHVAVIGGGAAGMMAAILLTRMGHTVTIYEKNEKLGKKLFITGKGRCNFTNACTEEEFFEAVSSNPRFLYSAYKAWPQEATIHFFEEAGLAVKIERGRRAFPVSDHAYDVIDTLKRELKKGRVRVLLNTPVTGIEQEAQEDGSSMVTGVRCGDRVYPADAVLVATGGLSYPTTGSTGDGYRFAKEAGHSVTDCCPSLVQFYTEGEVWHTLAGLTLKNVSLTVYADEKKVYEGFRELLFTHFGISGPLVLSASSKTAALFGKQKLTAVIDLKPAVSAKEFDERIQRILRENPQKQIATALRGVYPSSLLKPLLLTAGIQEDRKCALMTAKERKAIVAITKGIPLVLSGHGGYNEAVITKGGVAVKEVDPKWMESKLVKGLFFAGEVLDVDALTGGYNLQIAWCTAAAAARGIDRHLAR